MKGFLRGALWLMGIVGAICLLLYLFVFDAWTVPRGPDDLFGSSILPTMRVEDFVLIRRGHVPKIGELARCQSPLVSGAFVVGRVFGHHGDQVDINDGAVMTNGAQPAWRHGCGQVKIPHPVTQNLITMNCTFAETASASFSYLTATEGLSAGTSHALVEPGKLYLVSDNRLMHQDSRDFGQVDMSTCEHIVFRMWGEKYSDSSSRFTLLW